jgi:hypothetical protein
MEDVDRVDERHWVEGNKVILYSLHNHVRKRKSLIPKTQVVMVMMMVFVMSIHYQKT